MPEGVHCFADAMQGIEVSRKAVPGPVLYHLEVIVEGDKSEPIDRLVSRFGFREVWA